MAISLPQKSSLPPKWVNPGGYLDTANYGLPPAVVTQAVRHALALWESGDSNIGDWKHQYETARQEFAALIGARPAQVMCSSTTSQLVGLVAASLTEGDEVLVPEEEFTSNVFPWLAQERRGIKVRAVPQSDLAAAVTPSTSLVAFSLVQSATGAIAPLDDIKVAASMARCKILVDVTQSCGWLPFDAQGLDFVVCSAYKWLFAPRGCAFMMTADEWLDWIVPSASGWFSGEDIEDSLYGPPLRLAKSARRFDLSPAWICWAGTAPAIGSVHALGIDNINAHNMALASLFCELMELPTPSSAIVSFPSQRSSQWLRERGVKAAARAGRLRFSFHIYNTVEDVQYAAALLREKDGD